MHVEPTIEDQKAYYDKLWMTTARRTFLHQHLKNRLLGIQRFMELVDVKEPDILEIGCGLGYIANILSRFGRVEGIDLSAKSIEIARKRYPQAKFVDGDVFNHDFLNATYDVIVTSEVVEHIPIQMQSEFVELLWERLKPNGWLILTTPNKEISDRLSKDQPIENHFSRDELREWLGRHFDIIKLATVQNFFPILCHRSKIFQILRLIAYDGLRLRHYLEDPLHSKGNGLYFIVLARRKE